MDLTHFKLWAISLAITAALLQSCGVHPAPALKESICAGATQTQKTAQ